jgi:ATP-dependent protease ClpP protease subunit
MILKINIDGYIDKYGGFSLSTLKSMVESNPEATEIELFINSEGGDVYEGWAIHDYLVTLQNTKKVTAKIEGMVASITTIIIGALPKDNVRSTKNSTGYIHNPIWTPQSPTPMEADDLKRLSEDLKVEEEKIYNFYLKRLTAKAEEILHLMQNEIKLTADKMLEIGLIGSIENSISASFRNQLPIKAQINIDMQKEFTVEQKTWLEQKLSTIENSFKSLFKGTIKNMVVKLQDGTEVFVDTEDGDLMGKQVFLMDNGNMTETPAPDGEHVTEDGRTIVVAGGVVTEVKEAEDVEALKTELATAQAQNAELQNQVTEVTNQLNEVKTNFENTKTEFYNFKAQILNGEVEKAQDFPKAPNTNTELSLVEKALLIRKQNKQ